jgi:hypothetical protein
MDNVYSPGFSAGGSSSGTAVLVARGDVDLGIGGDQGGSIRLPSCCNGIVGLKPITGLVPYTGIASLEPILDHVGPMTRVSGPPTQLRCVPRATCSPTCNDWNVQRYPMPDWFAVWSQF